MAVLGKKPFFLDFKKNLCPTTPSTLEQVLGKSSKTTEFLKPPVFLLQKPESSFSQTKKPESLRRFPRNQKKKTLQAESHTYPWARFLGKTVFLENPPFRILLVLSLQNSEILLAFELRIQKKSLLAVITSLQCPGHGFSFKNQLVSPKSKSYSLLSFLRFPN